MILSCAGALGAPGRSASPSAPSELSVSSSELPSPVPLASEPLCVLASPLPPVASWLEPALLGSSPPSWLGIGGSKSGQFALSELSSAESGAYAGSVGGSGKHAPATSSPYTAGTSHWEGISAPSVLDLTGTSAHRPRRAELAHAGAIGVFEPAGS